MRWPVGRVAGHTLTLIHRQTSHHFISAYPRNKPPHTSQQTIQYQSNPPDVETKEKKCASRESNTGPNDGNVGFYH